MGHKISNGLPIFCTHQNIYMSTNMRLIWPFVFDLSESCECCVQLMDISSVCLFWVSNSGVLQCPGVGLDMVGRKSLDPFGNSMSMLIYWLHM